MFALVIRVTIENLEDIRSEVQTKRVNVVPRAPGFISAYWLGPIGDEAMPVIVFDTKEHAEAAMAYPVPPISGVSDTTVELREVVAHVGAP